MPSSKFLLLLSSASILMLSGCAMWDESFLAHSGGAQTNKATDSESLLAAEGSWALVEDEAMQDPVSMHKSAVKKVDPKDPRKKQYVPKKKVMPQELANSNEDINFRLIRMEREMQGLRQDFDKLLPPLSNLIVADQQLDTTIQEISSKPSTTPTRMMKSPDNGKPVQSIAPSAGAGTHVKALRFGLHPNKTRLVLDLNAPSTYSADVDNTEKLLLIDLPQASWATMRSKVIKNPLIAKYTAQPSANGGTTLVLELKKPVKIISSAALKSNATTGPRIYLDLAES